MDCSGYYECLAEFENNPETKHLMELVLNSVKFSETEFMLPKLHKDQFKKFCDKMESFHNCLFQKRVTCRDDISYDKFFKFKPMCQMPQRQGIA